MERIFQFSAQQKQRSITIWTASTCCQGSTSADQSTNTREDIVNYTSNEDQQSCWTWQCNNSWSTSEWRRCNVNIVHGFCAEMYGSRTPPSQWTTWTWTNELQVSLYLYLRRETWWLIAEEYPSCQSQLRFTTNPVQPNQRSWRPHLKKQPGWIPSW